MKQRMVWSLVVILVAAVGCGSKDKSKVLATVGTEKITEQGLEQQIRALAPTAKEADAFLAPEHKAEREQFLERLIQVKTMAAFGKLEGLDRDAKAKILAEQAMAQTYLQLMMERRMAGLKPTEAQIKADYDDLAGKAKASDKNAVLPPFEKVKDQLEARWKQNQAQVIQANLVKEMETKVKVVRAK